MENLFISALVKAGTCCRHGSGTTSQDRRSSQSRQTREKLSSQLGPLVGQTRQLHSRPCYTSQELSISNETTQDHYLRMLDYYRESSCSPNETIPNLKVFNLPDLEPREEMELVEGPAESSHSSTEREAIRRLIQAIEDLNCSHDDLFEYYRALPSPGIKLIPPASRHTLLNRFSTTEKKSEKDMLRYLSLIDDTKLAGLLLQKGEWNSAIHLAGMCFSTTSALEVENALRIWKEMEVDAGVRGNTSTFSILFDIATKAGQFPLAEMILKEMKERKLQINRFTRVGLIYYHGLRGDGDGIRRAYRELVETGEIVETTVLNCVIAALLKAGEPNAAENVYERMKRMYAKQSGRGLLSKPPNNRKDSKKLGQVLKRLVKRHRDHPVLLKELQDDQPLTPNTQTFIILIKHHVSETGELHHIAQLLDDMQALEVPVHGRVFMELFRGFSTHGGVRYTSWTQTRLRDVWQAYLKLHDEGVKDIYTGKWMAIWAMRAFTKCSDREETLEIWEELKSRWKAEDGGIDNALEWLRP